jgi:hypothetical protein
MILESTDTSFSSVAAVDLWWYQLEVDFFVGHVLFEYFGAFVIEALEPGSEAGSNKSLVELFVGVE